MVLVSLFLLDTATSPHLIFQSNFFTLQLLWSHHQSFFRFLHALSSSHTHIPFNGPMVFQDLGHAHVLRPSEDPRTV